MPEVAFSGRDRTIDAGEIDGRLFFNVAGVGLDARVAHRFAVDGLEKRGFARYMSITIRELAAYEPDHLAITTAASTVQISSLLVAIANGREYGNGAVVAPHAQLDDGLLDVAFMPVLSRPDLFRWMARCLAGRHLAHPGLVYERGRTVVIESDPPSHVQIDGDRPGGAAAGLLARLELTIEPAALAILAPRPDIPGVGGQVEPGRVR